MDNLTNAWIRRIQKKKMPTWLKLDNSMTKLVSLAAVFSIVTQRSSPRDDTKNGCEGDYDKTG